MKLGDCEYREGFLYDPEGGTWGREEGGLWRVGVAPLLSWLSGAFTSFAPKPLGTRLALGSVAGSVEGPKHFEVVRAPFDCVIRGTNQKLVHEPRLANKDSFGEGWLMLVERVGAESRFVPLETAAAAIEDKIRAMGVHCFAEYPDVEMFEVGVECSAVLVRLNALLAEAPGGTVAHVASDDPTAGIEMERWKDQTGNEVLEVRPDGPVYHFIVRKS